MKPGLRLSVKDYQALLTFEEGDGKVILLIENSDFRNPLFG
jgi:hypothetical protein